MSTTRLKALIEDAPEVETEPPRPLQRLVVPPAGQDINDVLRRAPAIASAA